MSKRKFSLADREKWNAGKSLHERAKFEERQWRKGLSKKKAARKKKAQFYDEWELAEITKNGFLIFKSKGFKGIKGEPLREEDVPF